LNKEKQSGSLRYQMVQHLFMGKEGKINPQLFYELNKKVLEENVMQII